jgi:hypothetical protein
MQESYEKGVAIAVGHDVKARVDLSTDDVPDNFLEPRLYVSPDALPDAACSLCADLLGDPPHITPHTRARVHSHCCELTSLVE